MPAALTIVGAPVRTSLRLNELPRALAQEAPDLVVFERSPVPGRIMGAAFDWVAVLGTTADLLAIAGALWAVYVKVVKPRKAQDKPPAFLIQVKTQEHTFVQLLIQENTTEEVFVEEFCRTVTVLRAGAEGESTEVVVEKYANSEEFRRVHVRKDA